MRYHIIILVEDSHICTYIECLNKLNHDMHIRRFFSSNEINKKINDWENKYDQSFKNHIKNIVSSWEDINYDINQYEHQNNRFSILKIESWNH